MRSKMSLFNIGIILEDLRRFMWVAIGYLLALIFAFPIQIIMLTGRSYIDKYQFENLLFYRNVPAESIIILAIPVLMGILLFRYIQVKNSTDMIHSLPIKRSTLFASHITVSALLLIVPVIITGILVMIMHSTMGLEKYFTIYSIWNWIGLTILFDMVFLLFSVLFGMVVGISLIQGVFTYIFLFLPLGLVVLVTYNLKAFLYGFTFNLDSGIDKYSPLARILEGFNQKLGTGELIAYIAFCIVVLFLSAWLYNKRKLEAASESIAFKSLTYIFVYGVTFCTALLAGAYFQQVQGNKIYWMIFGYIAGTFVGYFAAQMIVKKSVFVFKTYRGFLASIGIIAIILIGLKFDITGFEGKLPAPDRIKDVYFSSGFYNYDSRKYGTDFYYTRSNIMNIYNLHMQLIRDRDKNMAKNRLNLNTATIVYELNDGSTLKREYLYSPKDYLKFVKPLSESMEFKKIRYDALNIDSQDVEKITITPNNKKGAPLYVLKPIEITELMGSLKQDIKNTTYEQMSSNKATWGDISLLIQDSKLKKYPKLSNPKYGGNTRDVHVSFEKYYAALSKWLESKGYLEASRVMPSDIDRIIVEKVGSNDEFELRLKSPEPLVRGQGKQMEITDKSQIETCLISYNELWDHEGSKYIIGFYGKDSGNVWYGTFKGNNTPEFIEKYFNE